MKAMFSKDLIIYWIYEGDLSMCVCVCMYGGGGEGGVFNTLTLFFTCKSKHYHFLAILKKKKLYLLIVSV